MDLFKDRLASRLGLGISSSDAGRLQRRPESPLSATSASLTSRAVSKPVSLNSPAPAPAGEQLEVQFFCAKSGEAFTVVFARPSDSARFRIREAQTDSGPGRSVWDRLGGKRLQGPTGRLPVRQEKRIDITQCDLTGFSCPYCAADQFVEGHCGHLTCSGTVTGQAGGRHFQCFCGHSGMITGTLESVAEKQRTAQPAALPSLPWSGTSKTLLTGFPKGQRRLTDQSRKP